MFILATDTKKFIYGRRLPLLKKPLMCDYSLKLRFKLASTFTQQTEEDFQ